jgi:hypothetical protein
MKKKYDIDPYILLTNFFKTIIWKMRTCNHLLEIERVDTQILKGKNIFVVIVLLNEIKDENHFLFNFPLNLALRNELFVKIEKKKLVQN